jgi:myosin-5
LENIIERAPLSATENFDDMVNMDILNDAELLENVRKRFQMDLIFTFVGPTLIVLNPFKRLP